MKKWFLFTFLSVVITGIAQPAKQKNVSFPQSFIGKWKGTLTWYIPGKTPQKFTMRLNIQVADSGRYTWQIIYGDDQKDNRPYLLVPVDTVNGHWVIDERNSIILDSYWIGNRFIGAFTVQNSTIVDQYRLEPNGLHVEFITYAAKPLTTTGGTSNDIPPVDSYQVRSIQSGVLKKIK